MGCKHQQNSHLSITDPKFNLREIIKQLLLLEQHLIEGDKRCPECICKHILHIEGLAEEAVSLDKHGQYVWLNHVASFMRQLYAELRASNFVGNSCLTCAKRVRGCRKALFVVYSE